MEDLEQRNSMARHMLQEDQPDISGDGQEGRQIKDGKLVRSLLHSVNKRQ